jgi:3-deoxy-7-phosphoheptulonate synthase
MKDISQEDTQNNIPLVTRLDTKREVNVGDIYFGNGRLVIMAGPCTVESKKQIFETAEAVKDAGAHMLRGGVFKPLTFPYGEPLGQPDAGSDESPRDRMKILSKHELFQAAEKRLAYFKEAGEKFGLPIISEIIYADSLAMMAKYVDMFQVGYRHMFNMDLIEVLSKTEKPVMLKRHYGESLRSLLGVAEHFEARGKHNFVFCDQAIPALKEYAPSVPVIIDPSHSTFKRSYVVPMSRAAIAAGADGLLIEVHPDPENAWVDPLQALGFKDFRQLMAQLKEIHKIISRKHLP